MKLKLPKDEQNNRVPPPPIWYKPDPNICKTPQYKSDSLKVNIMTQPG